MTRRLVKRHKRQVARAKSNVKLSEPDVRTPEQVKAARDASRGGARRNEPVALYVARSGPAEATAKEKELP